MRLATRISELERKRKRQSRSPEIKVFEVWEVAREFDEDGTEHVTEILIEAWHLPWGSPEEARKENRHDPCILR